MNPTLFTVRVKKPKMSRIAQILIINIRYQLWDCTLFRTNPSSLIKMPGLPVVPHPSLESSVPPHRIKLDRERAEEIHLYTKKEREDMVYKQNERGFLLDVC
ncbi:hypothetical protein TNIN_80761 [Trichonephila inaurata madagascariensis]|uniref:Uncharacterized protein n=1 Tax=Trichonephila inaurata madagascariensis TaxID=2747483 RepID=A0A8X6YIG4_9ARAC|nr:hypothetical protein TNIN_80761 [Trichonephila inaurata madagascariensis]